MKIHASNLRWGLLSKYRTELMGIACLWVMLHHNFFDWPPSLSVLQNLIQYGSLAVDIFLLLSGVGLYYVLQKNPPLDQFYRKRLSRVLIPYLLFAAPYWLWLDACADSGSFWQDLTQLSFPLCREITTWYIPTIIVFYLVSPWVERFLLGGSRRIRTAVLCFGWIAFCLAIRDTTVYHNCEIGLTRFVIFTIGCCLGKYVHENRLLSPLALPLSIGWLFVNWLLRRCFPFPTIWIRFSYVPLALAVTLLWVWILERLQTRKALRRFLLFFGEHSLELYLTHILIRNVWVHYLGNRFLDPWGIIPYGLILLISVAVSWIAHPIIIRFTGLVTSTVGKEKKWNTP